MIALLAPVFCALAILGVIALVDPTGSLRSALFGALAVCGGLILLATVGLGFSTFRFYASLKDPNEGGWGWFSELTWG